MVSTGMIPATPQREPVKCVLIEPGLQTYARTLELQEALRAAVARRDGSLEAALVVVEHPPVITLGAAARQSSMLVSVQHLRELGVELVQIDRGGDATYHGPGQVVAYPIADVRRTAGDVHAYLRLLEEAVIGALAEFGLVGHRHGPAGVWVGDRKVCSIGIAVRQWVSYHGLALNVCPNLSHFRLIRPCGLNARQITSMEELLGEPPDVNQVKRVVIRHLCDRLSLYIVPRRQGLAMLKELRLLEKDKAA